MSKIILGGGDIPRFDNRTLNGMFAFRHEIFYRRLGWEVSTRGEFEVDEFDELDPTYMLAKNDHGIVEGCWRLLPTTGPYMLKNTFPQLLRGEPAPSDEHIWELSRFAVDSKGGEGTAQACMNSVAMDMIRTAYDYALTHQIERYVTVTSVALERMLKRTGLPIRRLGDGKAQKVGKVLTVACWIEINECKACLYPELNSMDLAA